MNGPDEMLLMGLTAGADGGIGATYNFMLPLFCQIYHHFVNGRLEDARQYQMKVTQLITALRAFSTIPAANAAVATAQAPVPQAMVSPLLRSQTRMRRVLRSMNCAN
jgi:dihydrodipicolinate synthase/N-acetylneuraminate lyase